MAKAAAKIGSDPTALVAMEQYFPEGERIIQDNLGISINTIWKILFMDVTC